MINQTSTWLTTLLVLSGAPTMNQNYTIVPHDGDVGAEYKFYGFIGCTKEDTAKITPRSRRKTQ
jgi:hypothetical protein